MRFLALCTLFLMSVFPAAAAPDVNLLEPAPLAVLAVGAIAVVVLHRVPSGRRFFGAACPPGARSSAPGPR